MCRRDSIGFRIPSDDRPRALGLVNPPSRFGAAERGRRRPLLCAPASRRRRPRWLDTWLLGFSVWEAIRMIFAG
jgi:hypothetical protein